MVSRDEVARRAEICRAEVFSSRDGFLGFRSRRHLILAAGEAAAPQAALEGSRSPGHRVRSRLALLVAERGLPVWTLHHNGDPGDVGQLMDLARAAADGLGNRTELFDEGMALYNHLGDGGPEGDRGIDYIYAAKGIACAVMTIARDDQLLLPRPDYGIGRTDVENPDDPDMFDCAFWGAVAEAGDLPWGAHFEYSRDAAVAYWTWYLDIAVPQAFGAW